MKKLLVLVLIISMICGCKNNTGSVYDTLVVIDVNPSIQLKLDKDMNVVGVDALNVDARDVLKDMDMSNLELSIVMNALLGSMVQAGYLGDQDNLVIISVENDNEDRRVEIESYLSKLVEGMLGEFSIEGAVLSQEYRVDDDIEYIMKEYDVSYGKAVLTDRIIESDVYNVEDLVKLDSKELLLIDNQNNGNDVSDKVDTSSYIDKEEALSLVLKDSSLSKDDISNLNIEYDSENGIFTYEIDFKAGDKEYEYDVRADNGSFIKDVESKPVVRESSEMKYTKEQALALVLKDAGLVENQIAYLDIEADSENGVIEYDIEFMYGNKEYSYEVSSSKGIVDKEVEEDLKQETVVSDTYTKEQALTLVLKDVGLTEDQISNLHIECDSENGVIEYDIEFRYGNKEYSYEVSNRRITDKDIDD